MSITPEAVKEMVGLRVKAKIGRDWTYGICRSLTPTDRVIIANDRSGVETLVERDQVSKLEDARYECTVCHTLVNRVFSDENRCADCERVAASKEPTPRETCETCGVQGAFYSPRSKKFGCPQCQAKAGALTGIGAEARVLTHSSQNADCRSDDIDSLRHQWTRSKSSYHCRLCYVKVFQKPAGYRG